MFIDLWYHRRLQSCVGTRARLGYAAFDAQLRKRIALHCTLYMVVCTWVSTLMLVFGLKSIMYELTSVFRNFPGLSSIHFLITSSLCQRLDSCTFFSAYIYGSVKA